MARNDNYLPSGWNADGFRTEEEDHIEWCIEHPVRSRTHVWEAGQQAEYNLLKAQGRRLYDNLRTQYNWEHEMAVEAAVREFGRKA